MLTDMLEACRLCMCREKDNMRPIFDHQSLATKIMWISDLKMFAGDSLPAQICQQCYIRVNSAFFFKEQIIGIDRTLREMMGQNMDAESISIPSSTSPEKAPQEAEQDITDTTSEIECYDASDYDNLDAQEIKVESLENVVVELNSDGEEAESTNTAEKPSEDGVVKRKWNFQMRKKTKRRRDRNFLRQPHKRGGRQMPPLKCPICSKVLHSNLARHVKKHYEEGSRVQQVHINGIIKETPDEADILEALADPTWVSANSVLQPSVEGRIDCPICGKVVTSSSYLKMHMHSHNSDRSTFKCSECPRVFYNLGNLRGHMSRVHGISVVSVPPPPTTPPPPEPVIVTLAPDTPAPVSPDPMIEHDEKPPSALYSCNKCSGVFSSNSNLRNHILAIHEFTTMKPSSFRCEMCELSFNINSSLQNHVREVHHGAYIPKPYRCDTCPQSFAVKASLLGHMRMHSRGLRNKMIYSCTECEKTFSKMRSLTEHRKTHEPLQVTVYPCNLCDKSFTKYKYYTIHYKNHEMDKQFKCELCPKAFYEKSSLVRHMRINHDVSASADVSAKADDAKEVVANSAFVKCEGEVAKCVDEVEKCRNEVSNCEDDVVKSDDDVVECPVVAPVVSEDQVVDLE